MLCRKILWGTLRIIGFLLLTCLLLVCGAFLLYEAVSLAFSQLYALTLGRYEETSLIIQKKESDSLFLIFKAVVY